MLISIKTRHRCLASRNRFIHGWYMNKFSIHWTIPLLPGNSKLRLKIKHIFSIFIQHIFRSFLQKDEHLAKFIVFLVFDVATLVIINFFFLTEKSCSLFKFALFCQFLELRGDLCKSGPGHFASEKSFPSNFAQ